MRSRRHNFAVPNAPEIVAHGGKVHAPGLTWARAYRDRLRITDTLIILASITVAFLLRFGFDATAAKVGPTALTTGTSPP